MSEYRINVISLGNITKGRCFEAEKKLGELMENCLQLLTITPWSLLIPGKPTMMPDGQVGQSPPQAMQTLVVVTEHLEGLGNKGAEE